MFNKNMLVVSASVAVAGVGFGIYKVVKNINEQKKKENTFLNVLKECIEEEADYCVDAGILHKNDRDKVIERVFQDTKEMVKNNEESAEILNMSPEEQKEKLSEAIKNSRSIYAMYGWVA
nr:MAG TPA: hypothetical protein [Caudoviricetes sp.]